MAITLDLEHYPLARRQVELKQEIAVAHAEHQKHAFMWAMQIIEYVAAIDDHWLDPRNSRAVHQARAVRDWFYSEGVYVA